jgi:hypothetical protein
MKKLWKMSLMGLFFTTVAAPVVHAQATQPVLKPITIKLGIFLPTEGSGRSQGGSTQFSIGADYAFTKTANQSPTIPIVFADYQGGGSGGGHLDTTDVGIGVRIYPNRTNLQTVVPFYGIGVGAYFVDAKNNIGRSSNNTQIGGKVEIGAEMNTGPFVEADYQYVPQSVQGIRASGVNIRVGDRF